MPASGARTTFLILGLLIASTTNAAGSSSSGCSLAGSLAPPGDEKWAPVSHLPLPLITLSNATTSAAAATASTSTGTSDASGRRLIFVRRMRKAGSTSLRAFFAALGKARGWDVQANEFLAFNGKCVGNPFVRAQVLLVAHLRDPLQRLNSEFFYVGPGSSRGGLKPSDEHTWASWMNASAARKAEGTFEGLIRGGLYLDNLYVRALTGDCAAACLPGDGEHADAGGGDADINRGGGTGGGGGSSALAGGAAPRLSGCRLCRRKVCGEGVPGFRPTLGSADLAAARSALDHFDLVITIELLGAPSYAARLRSLVHAPPDVDIGHARANPAGGHGSSSSSSGSGSSGSSSSSGGNVGRPPVPAAIKTRLATENALDLALYREWRARQEACAG